MTKVFFIFGTTLFFLFIVQVSALFGVEILTGGINGNEFTPPSAPTSILDFLGFVAGNFVIFFQLMTTSSSFLIFGSVIVTTYVIALLWALLELIRGV